jgi:hypothetical protein
VVAVAGREIWSCGVWCEMVAGGTRPLGNLDFGNTHLIDKGEACYALMAALFCDVLS